MIDFSKLQVFSPGYDAVHWGFDYSQIVSSETAQNQTHKIAVLPVFYNRPSEFSYRPGYEHLDISGFDLVLFTDIEFRPQQELIAWIETLPVTNWLLQVGGLWQHETLDMRTMYRPSWAFNFLQWNTLREDFPLERPFLFDCLCGTRRQHRDYVMLALIQSGLLDQGIATYRDVFVGGDGPGPVATSVQQQFPGLELPWPYVSANLDPAWEVKPELDFSVSGLVPWEIYNRTWFSILVETLGHGDTFLMAEKIGKCLHARRLFVHFGVANWLRQLRALGFETFGSVIDESYDTDVRDIFRWRRAFEQVQYLGKQNMPALMQKIKPILDHNHHRLYELRTEKYQESRDFLLAHLK